MSEGALALVLHAHLPYVRHPDYPQFNEEDWLFEAIYGCYLPLAELLERQAAAGRRALLTLSLSPPLMAMLDDELLKDRFDRYLTNKLSLLQRAEQCQSCSETVQLLVRLQRELCQRRDTWVGLDRDLIGRFVSLDRQGVIELATTAATHGYLPVLRNLPHAVPLQVGVGCNAFAARCGRDAETFWLPECGYYPGLERVLGRFGIGHIVLDTHALSQATPPAQYGCYRPIRLANTPILAFARDPSATTQVWSREVGYPADPDYREFHRDLLDVMPPSVTDAFDPRGVRRARVSLWAASGREDKLPYRPKFAYQRAEVHAQHFVDQRAEQLIRLATEITRPIAVAAFDAELFGHWWHEGPLWLEQVLERAWADQRLALVTLAGYAQAVDTAQRVQPQESSWGEGGYHQVWLNATNDWIYRELDRVGRGVVHADTVARPQLLREWLLAQSSDWAFLVNNGAAGTYPAERVRDHIGAIDKILEASPSSGAAQIASERFARWPIFQGLLRGLEFTDR